jgi:integrase
MWAVVSRQLRNRALPIKHYGPHSLRHACATRLINRGLSLKEIAKDVQKLLPQLSVYMGHTHLAATQAYLTMTPELLHEASLRFERYATREVSND